METEPCYHHWLTVLFVHLGSIVHPQVFQSLMETVYQVITAVMVQKQPTLSARLMVTSAQSDITVARRAINLQHVMQELTNPISE